jgi:2-oxoglutarate ferredoxin oxidoreductase subunit alpha
MYGRHSEAPLPILAPMTPSDCFATAIEAVRLAVKYRTPVIVLSDGYLANGSEPWRLPDVNALEPIDPEFASEPNHVDEDGHESFWPYIRDPETLARPWAPPGLPGLEHRIGGLEKEDGSGNVSYEGVNHERMVHLRRDKVAGIAADIPLVEVNDETGDAELLLVSWGSTYAAVFAGVKRVRARGMKAAHVHLRHLNPLPSNLGEVLDRYTQILVPEGNLGQLSRILRAEYLVDAQTMSKIQGVPFRVGEIEAAITALLGGKS